MKYCVNLRIYVQKNFVLVLGRPTNYKVVFTKNKSVVCAAYTHVVSQFTQAHRWAGGTQRGAGGMEV